LIKKIFILTFGLWCLAASSQLVGATEVKDAYYENSIEKHDFKTKDWNAAKKGIDFTPLKEKKKKEEEARRNNGGTSGGNNGGGSSGGNSSGDSWDFGLGDMDMSGFFKILLILMGVALAAALIFRIAGGSFEIKGAKKKVAKKDISSTVNIKNVEANLNKSDMEILIDQSLKEKNYMLAVRLHYLWAIKELNSKKLIRWKRDKTNRDYMREMRKTDLNKPFREVTNIFERVWYGSQETLGQSDYLTIQKKLGAFIEQVKRR